MIKIKGILLTIILSFSINSLWAQKIPYGNNPETGKYIQTDDAKIYYEIYGRGEPLLLIHGSLYGYIDEFSSVLPDLIQKFKVIAVALRGHGKSEIGNQDFSYRLFVEDIVKILDNEEIDSTSIIGFSSGAITAVKIATVYPERVIKVVSIAGALGAVDKRYEMVKKQQEMTGEEFVKKAKGFVDNRKKLMPEPNRFIEFYDKLKVAHLDSIWISDEDASEIMAPILIIGGDRDEYFDIKAFDRMYSLIPNSRLLIVPNSGHVDVLLNKDLYLDYAIPFLMD